MAFVEMSSPAEAKAAIEGLDGRSISGRTVKAKYATQPRPVFSGRERAYVNPTAGSKKQSNKDLDFEQIQLAKKERNEKKRKANPIVMKYVPAKKK
jgi:RNA recognition motif-containing protein